MMTTPISWLFDTYINGAQQPILIILDFVSFLHFNCIQISSTFYLVLVTHYFIISMTRFVVLTFIKRGPDGAFQLTRFPVVNSHFSRIHPPPHTHTQTPINACGSVCCTISHHCGVSLRWLAPTTLGFGRSSEIGKFTCVTPSVVYPHTHTYTHTQTGMKTQLLAVDENSFVCTKCLERIGVDSINRSGKSRMPITKIAPLQSVSNASRFTTF